MKYFSPLLLSLATLLHAQDYGPFDLGTVGGSRVIDVTSPSGRLILDPGSTGGGTGGRNYAFSEPRNGSSISSGSGHEYVSFTDANGTRLVAACYWWVSLSEDGSWGYYDALEIYVRVTVPANQIPSIRWTTAPDTATSGQSYTVAAQGNDADGNLAQVRVWKNGQPFALAGGGNGTDSDASGNTQDDGPQSVTFTAQAADATGAVSALITHTVAITPPPPAQYTLTTTAGIGGGVSGGGVFPGDSTVTVTATPDATHDLAGWSGDASGTANPLGVLLDRNKTVSANFALKNFALTTSATAGGAVTPGGTYPYGTQLTLEGTADATHRFLGWAGDASGPTPSITVLVDRALWVQAVFTAKTAQTISFAAPGNQPVGGAALTLNATASSGLSVTYTLLSGPAILTGNQLTMTGPGAVIVQASQPGDAEFLPAPAVVRTVNAVTTATVKYRSTSRTLLHEHTTSGAAPIVLENP